jgi:thioredoxin-related protein
MRSIHKGFAACVMLVAAAGALMAPESEAQGKAASPVEWRTINEALSQAPESGRLILLDVYTDWCGWCKRMDRDTYTDSTVAALIAERFIAAKMNPEEEGTVNYLGQQASQSAFGHALGVDGYPATVFFNAKGERIAVVPGYLPAKDFALLLRFIAEEKYKSMTWDDWVKSNA